MLCIAWTLLFLPNLSFSQQALTNQRLYDTIPYIPDHYKERVKQFKEETATKGRVIFLGNSITEMGPWQTLLNDSTIVNRGISGDITFGILSRIDEITERKPSKLFMMIGINDIAKDIPESIIADNCRKVIQKVQAQSPGTVIYLQSVLPLDPAYPGFPQHYDKQSQVLKLNLLLKELALTRNIKFINLFPLFLDSRKLMNSQYTYDGLHLNQKGYEIWCNYLKKEKLFP
jgi:lysophospholipase L1-like esterase